MDILRRCRFSPYRKGCGPTFSLIMWDTHKPHGAGPQWCIGYQLVMHDKGKRTVLFDAEDYGCAPGDAIDSDACVEGLMSFLTLRPGDTDEDYFAAYTDEQRDYCASHAEALSCTVQFRFCDKNGNPKKG